MASAAHYFALIFNGEDTVHICVTELCQRMTLVYWLFFPTSKLLEQCFLARREDITLLVF